VIKFKKKRAILAVIVIITALSACINPWEVEKATITLNLGGKNSRAAVTVPDDILNALNYTVVLTGPTEITPLYHTGTGSITAAITPGNWHIDITAHLGEILFATGSKDVGIKAGQNTVTVELDVVYKEPVPIEPVPIEPIPIGPEILTVDIAAITGVIAPITGATPITTNIETDQYTGTVTWNPPVSGVFANLTAYTAIITLNAKDGFTFNGVEENFFTVTDATTTNDANSGEVKAEFPRIGALYVAGNYENNTACYWVNGVRINLSVPEEATYSEVTAITVSDGSVYITGLYSDSDQTRTACYWVNGVRTNLTVPDGADSPEAAAIAVSGNSVYIAGSYMNNVGGRPACYWVNTIANTGDTLDIYRGIAVESNNVYIAGIHFDPVSAVQTACYWVNGVRTNLLVPNGADYPEATAITVSDGSVYITGNYFDSDEGIYKACYWVNGNRLNLPVPNGAIYGGTTAITVSDNSVYIAGIYENDGVQTACYWVNGARTDLTVPDGSTNNTTTAIAVYDGAVYIAGSIYFNESTAACYWVNGERIDLDSGTAKGIAVVGAE